MIKNDWSDYPADPAIMMGSASTLNTSAQLCREGEELPKNPIGFIWPEEKQ